MITNLKIESMEKQFQARKAYKIDYAALEQELNEYKQYWKIEAYMLSMQSKIKEEKFEIQHLDF